MAKNENQDKDIKDITEAALQKGKGGAIKWIIIGMFVLFIVGASVVGSVYFLTQAKGEKKEQQTAGILWTLDPFIVNLVDNGGERYLKVAMQFEVHDPALLHELDMAKPRIRDTILDLLSSKSQVDLVDSVGKQKLKEEIVMRTNNAITTGKISNAYFTEFVIQ